MGYLGLKRMPENGMYHRRWNVRVYNLLSMQQKRRILAKNHVIRLEYNSVKVVGPNKQESRSIDISWRGNRRELVDWK